MKSRSESRLRYLIASTFIDSPCTSYAAHADRSARRTTVRATWSSAAPWVPPLRMKERSVRQVLVVLVAPRLEPVDVLLLDAQRRVLGLRDHRRAEVGAHVEEVVLHPGEQRDDVVVEAALGEREPEVGVGLVDVGVRRAAAGRSWW